MPSTEGTRFFAALVIQTSLVVLPNLAGRLLVRWFEDAMDKCLSTVHLQLFPVNAVSQTVIKFNFLFCVQKLFMIRLLFSFVLLNLFACSKNNKVVEETDR